MTPVGMTPVVQFIASALAVVVLLAGVLAVLFSQLRKNTTQYVRDENTDLRQRIATVEGNLVIAEERESRCNERLSKTEATLQILSDMVTGATAVSELAKLVGTHHDEVLSRLDTLDGRLANLR